MVLNSAIVLHINGNASGGGVQDGLNRSLKTGSSFEALGRELSKGENTRLLRLMKSINTETSAEGRPDMICLGNFAAISAGKADLIKFGSITNGDSLILLISNS